jgi:hypothetical protein
MSSSGVAIMFKSQTASASRIPHLATVVALVFTIAIGVMQSAIHAGSVSTSTASVTAR